MKELRQNKILFKRFIAVIVVLLLSVSLCGCASEDDIVGSFKAQLDISEAFNSRHTDASDIQNYSLSTLG
ncbi:MAG: hypothetical protein U0L72_09355 [Acutalibacteraceae bacterium]|nr:hypothetical protein [Acutalibacteraceae bacterium]